MSAETEAADVLRDRVVVLSAMHNVRWVGGVATSHGTMAMGRLLRGDAPDELAPADLEMLTSLGVRTVIDLREPEERMLAPGRLGGPGVEVIELPLLGASPHAPESLLAVYRRIVHERGGQVVAVLRALLAPDALPALVHCTGGKDRTGMIVAILLRALGVSEREILADYRATSELLAPHVVKRWRARAISQGLPSDRADDLIATSVPDLQTVLCEIGDVIGYLRAHGLSDRELGAMRTRFLA